MLAVHCFSVGQCICLLCVMVEHKGHHTVSVAAESKDKLRKMIYFCPELELLSVLVQF